jgi:hypothetical protein
MLVKVLNFGSNWWSRFGRDPHDGLRFTRHAAYFNSTGVRCGRKIRRHWIVPGLVRFNGVGDFSPHFPDRCLGRTFDCPEPAFMFGGNRLLLARRARGTVVPDSYLVVISGERYGECDFTAGCWHSPLARVIAASQLRNMQEAMLLMKPGDWVKTICGFWQLRVSAHLPFGAMLELVGDHLPGSN